MEPRLGQIVYYYPEYQTDPHPAMITKVFGDGACLLTAFHPTSVIFLAPKRFSEEPKPLHWSWIPLTEAHGVHTLIADRITKWDEAYHPERS